MNGDGAPGADDADAGRDDDDFAATTIVVGRGTAGEPATLPLSDDERERAAQLSLQSDRPPLQVPGFTITAPLGEGAYGAVWLAREHNTGKLVAIKFYTHRRGLDWTLLNREVEKLAVLYTSRHIVGLQEVGWDSDPPYYVMEYLENGSLAGYLESGPLPPAEAVRIAQSVLLALVHAHGCGILHCDLKPANVLLDADWQIRICDFGQSRLSDEQSGALGTLFYMPPEQAALDGVPDARWDVYAVGALLYHMLTGGPPYRSDAALAAVESAGSIERQLAAYRRLLVESPRPTAHRRIGGVDRRLSDIVDRCLVLDPARRFPNPQAVLEALASRDRYRARRPLIALGVLAPLVLLGTIAPLVVGAMRQTVRTAERNLTARALESDFQSAVFLGEGLERELADRMSDLVDVAANPDLRAALQDETTQPTTWEKRTALRDVLDLEMKRIRGRMRFLGMAPDSSWFLTDATALQVWREPYDAATVDRRWAHRDYFHGQGSRYDAGNVPADVAPIRGPHVSQVFLSGATGRYMVALSVPVWDSDDEKDRRVIGVLARTSELGELLSSFEQGRHGSGADVDRVIALVDSRDGRLLSHPWMTAQHLKEISPEDFRTLRLPDATLARLAAEPADGPAPADVPESDADGTDYLSSRDRHDDYEDPVGGLSHDPEAAAYRGRWLAAFAPVGDPASLVGDTGWTAVIQERREKALESIGKMRSRLVRYVAWGLALTGSLLGLLWYFVMRALSGRRLRPWSSRRSPAGNGSHVGTGTQTGLGTRSARAASTPRSARSGVAPR
jgi:hypothetical protein